MLPAWINMTASGVGQEHAQASKSVQVTCWLLLWHSGVHRDICLYTTLSVCLLASHFHPIATCITFTLLASLLQSLLPFYTCTSDHFHQDHLISILHFHWPTSISMASSLNSLHFWVSRQSCEISQGWLVLSCSYVHSNIQSVSVYSVCLSVCLFLCTMQAHSQTFSKVGWRIACGVGVGGGGII